MIPNTIYLEGVAYYFYADTYQGGDFISYKYISRDINNRKIPFMSVGTTYKEAENKMIAVLQNAGILPKPDNRNRTIAQNALMWKWYEILSKDTGNTSEYLHERMKEKFLSKKMRGKLNGKVKYTSKKGSTKKLSVKQFTEYLDNVYLFFAENGYVLPTMDKLDMDSLINTYGNR